MGLAVYRVLEQGHPFCRVSRVCRVSWVLGFFRVLTSVSRV